VTVVLDADHVIGVLDRDDAHHARARQRFAGWHTDGTPRVLNAVNLTESLTGLASVPSQLRAAREAIAALGITIQVPNEGMAVEAARLRARHPIGLPDAYLLATARQLGARVASFDRRLLTVAAAEQLG